MRLLICLIVLAQALLGGCASQPTIITKTVKVPVGVPCVASADIPAAPQTKSRAEIMKLDRRKRTLTVWDERAQLKADDDQLRAMLKACSGGN